MKTQRLRLLFIVLTLALLVVLPAKLLAAIGDKYEVKGAGTAAVNGVYTQQANFAWGGAQYTYDNAGTTYYLCNDNAASPFFWAITDNEMDCQFWWGYYGNMSSSLTPPETGWEVWAGSSPAPTVVPYVPGANITKTGSSAFRLVAPGEPVTYTLQFSNTYTDTITGVVITDTLPISLTNVSVSSSGATVTPRGGTRYVWDVSNLAAGQSGTITITGNISETVAEGTQIDNTAEIAASQGGGSSSAGAFDISWWRAVGAQGISPGQTAPSLALDSAGVPYAAYRDSDNGGGATVMRYTGGSWQLVGSAGFSAGSAYYISLALDSSDVPYVAYRDGGNSNGATVMRYTSGAWQLVGSAGFSAGQADRISLALDSGDAPYVAYQDDANSDKATVMRYTGGSWQTVGTAGFSVGAASYTSLALDSTGAPYVAYRDGSSGSKATVMRYTGSGATGWEAVGSATGFSDGTVQYISLALDGADTPHVAYEDMVNGNRATVMRYTGGGATGWETVGQTGFTVETAQGVSIVLDSTGAPYVGFENCANGCKAAVMRHPGFVTRSVAYTSITAGQWYTFSTGCGGVYFTDIGSLDAVTLTARFGYTAKLGGGLPRDYDIETHGGGAYQADVRLCYDDVDLVYAGIDPAQEPNLHAYRYVGVVNWQEHSVVDTTNNHVTAEDVTNLDQDWGLGIPADQPTALALSTVEAGGGLPYLVATVTTAALGVTVVLALRRRRRA